MGVFVGVPKKNLTIKPLNFTNPFFNEGENQIQEFPMKCHRCGSVMVCERFYGSGGNFLGWRCIQCGEIIDEVILENRQAGTSRQSGR